MVATVTERMSGLPMRELLRLIQEAAEEVVELAEVLGEASTKGNERADVALSSGQVWTGVRATLLGETNTQGPSQRRGLSPKLTRQTPPQPTLDPEECRKKEVPDVQPWGEDVEDWEAEADPNRRGWSLAHGFYKPTPGRYGLVCWTCQVEGHRAVECPTRYGRPPRSLGPSCSKCGQFGHKSRWCRAAGDAELGSNAENLPVQPQERGTRPNTGAKGPQHGRSQPTPGRSEWLCFTYHPDGHVMEGCPTRWGAPPWAVPREKVLRTDGSQVGLLLPAPVSAAVAGYRGDL